MTIPHTLLHFRGHIANLGDNDCDSDRIILQLPAPSCEPPFCELDYTDKPPNLRPSFLITRLETSVQQSLQLARHRCQGHGLTVLVTDVHHGTTPTVS